MLRNNYFGETKTHYKLYKCGKNWAVMGISVFSLGLGMLVTSRPVSADVAATSTSSSAVRAETPSESSSSATKPDSTSESSSSAAQPAATVASSASDKKSAAQPAATAASSSSAAATVNVHADSNTDLATNDSVSGANSTSVTTGSAVALSTATSAASKSAVSVASQTSANTAVATSTASSESQTSAVKTNASTPTSTEVSSSSASSGQQKIDNSAAASSHSDSVSVASTASSNAEADNHSDTTSEVQAVTSSTSTEQTELMAAAKNLSVGRATSLDLLSDTDTTPATDITASATLQSDHDLYTEPTSDPTQTNPWTGQPTFMYLNDPNDATAILPYTDEHYIHYPTATGWTGYVYYVTDDAARGSEFGTKGFHQLHLWHAGDPSKGYAIAPFETPSNPAVDTYYHLYPDPQQATIVYFDDTTHKMLHYTNLTGGRTSSISNYDQTNILNAYANLGYEVVSNDFTKGFKYGDGTTKQQFYVHLIKKTAPTAPTAPINPSQPTTPTNPVNPVTPVNPTPSPQPTPGTTTDNQSGKIAKKGEVVYSLKKIYLYKDKTFKKADRRFGYVKKPRVFRPMFVVTDYAKSNAGRLRYKVRDVNHLSKTDGWTGYITTNFDYVRPVYYHSSHRTLTVINPRGVNEYLNKNLTGKVKNIKQGTVLHVTGFVKHNLTTRYVLSNGHYITGNRKLVKMGKNKQPHQLKATHFINRYADPNLAKRNGHFKKGTKLVIKRYTFSHEASLTKSGTMRYDVKGGYVTANQKYVKVIK